MDGSSNGFDMLWPPHETQCIQGKYPGRDPV